MKWSGPEVFFYESLKAMKNRYTLDCTYTLLYYILDSIHIIYKHNTYNPTYISNYICNIYVCVYIYLCITYIYTFLLDFFSLCLSSN